MATTSFALTAAGIALFSGLNNPGQSTQHVRGLFCFAATGTDCTIAMSDQVTNAGRTRYRVDGGAWVSLSNAAYSGTSTTVTVFTGLADAPHTVEVEPTNPQNVALFISGSVNPISVTGAAPAISYMTGYGDTLIPATADPTLGTGRRWQAGGLAVTTDNAPRLVGATEVLGQTMLRWWHAAATGCTARITANAGTVLVLELWRRATGGTLELVASSTVTAGADPLMVTLTSALAVVPADWFLLVNTTTSMSIAGVSVSGAASGTVPTLATVGVLPHAIVSGTSLTVTAGVAGQSYSAAGTYPMILSMLLGCVAWNYGVGSSALTNPPDTSSRPGTSREQYLTAVPNVRYWIEAHVYNDIPSISGTDFETNLTSHLRNVLRVLPTAKALVLGLEVPSERGLDTTYRATYLGTTGNPGSLRRSVTTLQLELGVDRAVYVDTDSTIALLTAFGSGWTTDGTHPTRLVTPIMAQEMYTLYSAGSLVAPTGFCTPYIDFVNATANVTAATLEIIGLPATINNQIVDRQQQNKYADSNSRITFDPVPQGVAIRVTCTSADIIWKTYTVPNTTLFAITI